MKIENQQLKAFLLDAGLLKEKQFEEAAKKAVVTNKKVSDVLVEEDLISKEEIIKLQAYILGIPFVNLEKESIQPDVLKIIPEPIARGNNIVAFRKQGNDLEVAMLDPEDLRIIEFIKKKADLKILPRLTTPSSIKSALTQYQKTLEAEFGEIIQKEVGGIKSIRDNQQKADGQDDLRKVAEELPVIRIVDTLMKHAILQRASDIHIEPSEKEVVVRYRIDGILRDAMLLPKSAALGIVARIKVLSNLRLDERRLPQDGRFKIETEDYRYSVRVSILPVFNGEKIVMRLLSETSKALSLESMGLSGAALERVQEALKKPTGMILVTGPTGSGKTTTIYAVMEILNTPDVNISTVEDPIEYLMPRINQTQINQKIGLTFANGLRSLVRQDPDIIMVGEIRDNETAGLAINAALTGHLVLSTLHTNSAAGALPRLLDMKVEPFLMISTLDIVIAQRLVRKLSVSKTKYFLSKEELASLGNVVSLDRMLDLLKEEKIIGKKDDFDKIPFWKPNPGVDSEDGYSSRIGIHEVLKVTPTIKNLIMKGATTSEIEKQAKLDGMMTMIEDGIFKAAQGLTTIEE